MKKSYSYTSDFILESGQKLEGITITYSDYGPRDASRIIWVCHALSGSSEVMEWWPGLFGKNQIFDPEKDRIICANVIGSCYGSTCPQDFIEPLNFPLITIKDIVSAHQILSDHLGINQIDILIGASLGGQQALEWSLSYSGIIKQLILVASNAFHSPFARAFNEVQRLALKADPTFGEKEKGKDGLKAARAIAMMSYRSYEDFSLKQSEDKFKSDDFKSSSYVRYQGEKFVSRFDASSYWYLTKAMDSHDIRRGRDLSHEEILRTINTKTLVIGIDSDLLFPVSEQKFLADNIPNAIFKLLQSPHGHDSFLIEYKKLNEIISDFLRGKKIIKPTILKTKLNYSY